MSSHVLEQLAGLSLLTAILLDIFGALFADGRSVSIVGSGGFEPGTDTFRPFYWLAPLAGTAVASLVSTYLMQIYTPLLRHTVALHAHGKD